MKANKVSDLTIDQLKKIIDELVKQNLEDFIEDIEALSSRKFIKSIEKSRKEYKEGKFKSFEEVFHV